MDFAVDGLSFKSNVVGDMKEWTPLWDLRQRRFKCKCLLLQFIQNVTLLKTCFTHCMTISACNQKCTFCHYYSNWTIALFSQRLLQKNTMISELLNNGMSRGKMFLILKTLVHCLLHFPGKKQPCYHTYYSPGGHNLMLLCPCVSVCKYEQSPIFWATNSMSTTQLYFDSVRTTK